MAYHSLKRRGLSWSVKLPSGAAWWTHSWLALPWLSLPALWPFLTRGLPQGHDIPVHLMRLVALHQAILAGGGYVRWMPDLALGYGYPLYNFYSPGSAYVAEVFRLAGFSQEQAIIGLFVLALIMGAWGMWRLAADFYPAASTNERGRLALVASTAYLYAPYVLTNVYVRGAIAEASALALLPWTLWSMRRLLIAERPTSWLIPCAVSVASLAIMHNLSLLLVAPFLAGPALLHLWRSPQRAQRLAWGSAAAVAAIGLSAFYWGPLLGERGYLANTFRQVAELWLPPHLWTWPNFIDASLLFRYGIHLAYPLGLAQLALALAGVWLARRRWSAEWLVLALTALSACVLIGRPWQDFWLGTPLYIVQFPWRLLGPVSAVLALFTAGCLVPVRWERLQGALAGLLIGLIVYTQLPRIEGTVPVLPDDLDATVVAHTMQFERQTGSLGATTNFLGVTSDFMPRWVDQRYGLVSTPLLDEHLETEGVAIHLEAASSTAISLRITSDQPRRLRFTTFYFPGWRALLDGEQRLAPYADTPLGLLTVDLPAGEHVLTLRWVGTPLQNAATFVTLLTLASLSFFAWRMGQARLLVGLFGTAALVAGLAWLGSALARPKPVQQPTTPVQADGLELVGYTFTRTGERELTLRPYWFVRHPLPDLQFYWRLTDTTGRSVTEARTRLFFDAVPATSLRSGTLVDDAYRLGLPAGLLAGEYNLLLCMAPDGACVPQAVGVVSLEEQVPPSGPLPDWTPVGARFGENLALEGYAISSGPEALKATGEMPVVTAGQHLRYTLYWRALRPVPEDYHSFVYLADLEFNIAARHDDILGPAYWPPRMWDTHTLQRDVYELAVPNVVPNGVYWPEVGVYDYFAVDLERLPVLDASGRALGGQLRLAPIKVLSAAAPLPSRKLETRFEDFARLLGYDLVLPPDGAQPGSVLTLTLYFQAEQATTRDLTRFVHLLNAENSLVAQSDGLPQGGRNPTWAWVPDEVIADTVQLTVPPGTPTGTYSLRVGLYDAADQGRRLTVFGSDDQPLPEGSVILTEIPLAP